MTKSIPRLSGVLQVVLLGLLVAGVLAQSNPLYQIPNRDGGLFMYMGSQMLKGKLLYVDIWDNKGPLIFYINALGLYLGRGLRWGVWGMEFVFVFFAAFFGFDLMKKNWGIFPAIFGSLIWLLALNNVERGGNFTEDYSLLFNFAALYLFWLNLYKGYVRLYLFLIGVTLCLSFLLRANNIGVQISIVLVSVITAMIDKKYRKIWDDLVWIGAGCLSILTIVLIYFQLLGTLDQMVLAGYTYNFFYSSGGTKVGALLDSFSAGIKSLNYLSVFPLLGFLVLLEKTFFKSWTETEYLRSFYLLILIGFPIEIVMSSLSGRNYPHYYICWLPYIGILSSLLIYTLVPKFNAYLDKYSWATLLVTVAMVSFLQVRVLGQYEITFGKFLFDRGSGVELVTPVAKYVRRNTTSADTVLVWGFQPYLNLMARRDSPTGILSYPVLVESPFSDELNARFFQDLVANRPALIVDLVNPDNDTIPHIDPALRETQDKRLKRFNPPSNLNAVFEFIFENYHLETQVDGVMIYRLNDSTP